MPKARVMTDDLCARMLEAFRTRPGVAAAAAKAAGVDPRTAKKAWDRGLKRSAPNPRYHESFQAIIDREQTAVRARLLEQEERANRADDIDEAKRRAEARAKAILDLTEERVQESQMIRTARATTMALLNNVANMAVGVGALGKQVRAAMEQRAKEQGKMTFKEATSIMVLVRGMATALRQCNDAGQKAMEMTRLLLGEPTSIMAIQHLQAVPLDEAQHRIAGAQRAIESLARAGVTTIDGNTNALQELVDADDSGDSGEDMAEGSPASTRFVH